MRNRKKIIVLNQHVDDATGHWQFPPLGAPGLHMGKCGKCGGDKHAPAGLVRDSGYTPYCPVCFPALGQEIIELKSLLDQQKPREDRAAKLKQFRLYLARYREALPPAFRNCQFRTYRPEHESQVIALDQLRKWVLNANNEWQQAPFFYLHGAPGLGKTVIPPL